MQALSYTTSNAVCRAGNVLDFDQYRRRMCAAREASCADSGRLSPARVERDVPDNDGQGAFARSAPRRARDRALYLDLFASMGVLVMTAAFTLRVLIF